MSLNASSGLFAVEVIIGLYALWQINKLVNAGEDVFTPETPEEEAADEVADELADNVRKAKLIIHGNVPTGASQADLDNYTWAADFILANPSSFTPDEIDTAQHWKDYLDRHPEEEHTPTFNAIIGETIRLISGPFPPTADATPYYTNFTFKALGVSIRPEDYPYPDIRQRVNAWLWWVNHPADAIPNTPPIDSYRGAIHPTDENTPRLQEPYPHNDNPPLSRPQITWSKYVSHNRGNAWVTDPDQIHDALNFIVLHEDYFTEEEVAMAHQYFHPQPYGP